MEKMPFHAQIASRALAWDIFERGMDPIRDPNWASSGAASVEEYAYWVMRACGIACVKMCVEAFGGKEISTMEWIQRGLALNGYLVVEEDGGLLEKGWIHSSLAGLMEQEGLIAKATPMTLAEIAQWLRFGGLFIASVSYELGTRRPISLRGGHLVVVRGIDLIDGVPVTVYLNNPSGRLPELQENAAVPVDRFLQAYTGRGVRVSSCQIFQ